MGGVALQACVNAYTQWLAKQHPKLVINSCTPGFIATDITKGMGATNPPEKGAVVPVDLVMGEPKGADAQFSCCCCCCCSERLS
jgi:NAD(P)-dependent dehydrogenase (short-subunit alcohol dehydrogenase family)